MRGKTEPSSEKVPHPLMWVTIMTIILPSPNIPTEVYTSTYYAAAASVTYYK